MSSCASQWALVFWTGAKTTSVVPVSDIRGDAEVGNKVQALWGRKMYDAKIISIGDKIALAKIEVGTDGLIFIPPNGVPKSCYKKKLANRRETLVVKKQNTLAKTTVQRNIEEEILSTNAAFNTNLSAPNKSTFDKNASPAEESKVSDGSDQVTNNSNLSPSQGSSHDTDKQMMQPLLVNDFNQTSPQFLACQTTQPSKDCCVFKSYLQPFVNAEGIALLESLVTCFKIAAEENEARKRDDVPSSKPVVPSRLSCLIPSKGKVELIPGSNVYIARALREMYVTKHSENPKEMLRQILRELLGDTYLTKASAKSIPVPILNAATGFVVSNVTCDKKSIPDSFTKCINNMCNHLRTKFGGKPIDSEEKQKQKEVKKDLKKPSKTPMKTVPSERVLRSSSKKESVNTDKPAPGDAALSKVTRNIATDLGSTNLPLQHADQPGGSGLPSTFANELNNTLHGSSQFYGHYGPNFYPQAHPYPIIPHPGPMYYGQPPPDYHRYTQIPTPSPDSGEEMNFANTLITTNL